MEAVLQKIDQEKENRFKKQWTKLDKGSKLNRLLLFVKMEKAEKNLSDNSENQLKTLLIQLHSTNLLNKTSEIEYDIENSTIINIHNLHFENDKYYFQKSEKTKKGTKKNTSQTNTSNLERHFNRSKKSTKTI